MADGQPPAPRRVARSFKHSRMAAQSSQPSAEELEQPPAAAPAPASTASRGGVSAPRILGEVSERASAAPHAPGGRAGAAWPPTAPTTTTTTGFPVVPHRRHGGLGLGRRAAARSNDAAPAARAAAPAATPAPQPAAGRGGVGVHQDAGGIHEENTARLAGMSEEEIAEAQQALRSSLPPELVRKLQQRGSERGAGAGADHTAAGSVAAAATPVATPRGAGAALGVVDEEAKLQWTTPVSAQETGPAAGGAEAPGPGWRFGFDGLVIGSQAALDARATELYHHGDQPALAGYTLGEVVMMVRSTVANQRVLALQILEALVSRACSDLRAGTVRSPGAVEILDTVMAENLRIPLLLRCALDDGHASVVRASIRTLHALLVDEQDVASRLTMACEYEGWRRCDAEPLGSEGTDTPASEEESTIGEQERRCFSDLVGGLVKMGCLPRMRYMLEVLELPQTTLLDIVRILRRISEHSTGVAREVAACPRLLDFLVASCVKSCRELNDANNCAWLNEVFGLLQQLCDSSSAVALHVFNMSDLVTSLSRVMIISGDAERDSRVSAVCGAMRLWRSFIRGAAEVSDGALPVASAFLDLYPALSACYIKPSSHADSTAEIASALLDNFELLCRPEFLENGDVQWAQVSGLFRDALWWLRELKPMMQESSSVPVTSAALIGSLLHFIASYTREIHRPTAPFGNSGGGGGDTVVESSPSALLDEHLVPCLQSKLLVALVQAAPSIVWSKIASESDDTESALHRCCPRLRYRPPENAASLNLVVGAVRWLYQCALLQGPEWRPSEEYSSAMGRFHVVSSAIQSGAGDLIGSTAELLRCGRMGTLLRVFSCRALLEHAYVSKDKGVSVASDNSVELIATAMKMIHSIGPGDEALCIEYVHDSVLADGSLRMLQVAAGEQGCTVVKSWQKMDLARLRREILSAVVRSISGAAIKTDGAAGTVDVELDAGPSKNLPFTKPLFMLPFQPNSSSDADSVVDDVSLPSARAGLQLFLVLSAARCSYGTVGDAPTDAMSLTDAWVFICRSLISSDVVWQDEAATAVTDAVLDQLVHIEGSGLGALRLQDATRLRWGLEDLAYGSSLSDLLDRLLSTYGEESFGEATLGRCVALFLREDQPMELRRQVWRYCAANGGGLLELLDPGCWNKTGKQLVGAPAPGTDLVSRAESSTNANEERHDLARAQQQVLLTSMAQNISASGRTEPPMFCQAADAVADFLRGADQKPHIPKSGQEAATGDDNDDMMEWERKQLLSELFSAAEAAYGRPTALNSILNRLGVDKQTQSACVRDEDALKRAFGLA